MEAGNRSGASHGRTGSFKEESTVSAMRQVKFTWSPDWEGGDACGYSTFVSSFLLFYCPLLRVLGPLCHFWLTLGRAT